MDVKEKAKDLIDWRELSLYKSKRSRSSFRRDRIPKTYQDDINVLIGYIEAWLNCKELTTKESLISEVEYQVKEQIQTVVAEIQKIGKNVFIKL